MDDILHRCQFLKCLEQLYFGMCFHMNMLQYSQQSLGVNLFSIFCLLIRVLSTHIYIFFKSVWGQIFGTRIITKYLLIYNIILLATAITVDSERKTMGVSNLKTSFSFRSSLSCGEKPPSQPTKTVLIPL